MNMESPQERIIDRLPEELFEISHLDNCYVRNRNGQSVQIKDIRKDNTCIFVFIRVS